MYPQPQVIASLDLAIETPDNFDAVILIAPAGHENIDARLQQHIAAHQAIDQRVGQQPVLLAASGLPGGRLIFSPTGQLNREYDDVRRIGEAAKKTIEIAVAAGSVKPLMVLAGIPEGPLFQFAHEVAYLSACQALWQPLEAREALTEAEIEPVKSISLVADEKLAVDWLDALEQGKRVARDLCGTEPERMAPPRFAEYCQQVFAGTAVKVEVVDDLVELQKNYPLLYAVGRASTVVERHRPCVIRLSYEGQGDIQKSLFFAGKGIVYDTGGADLKTGGHMAGMSRDKGGAAGVAGFMKVVAETQPANLKVVAEIGAVRNSIGADAFVADEIITSHGGMRVRIGNTDAEGRLVLADLLSHLREEAKNSPQPELFSVATLTGHAALAVGPYTALVENGTARASHSAQQLMQLGDFWGDPAEISRSRREDYDFVQPRSKADDLLSCNNGSSASTPRGHQFPMAFLALASGLDKHSIDSDCPMAYTHIDIAGSGVVGGDWQHDAPSGAPVTMLAARYLR